MEGSYYYCYIFQTWCHNNHLRIDHWSYNYFH